MMRTKQERQERVAAMRARWAERDAQRTSSRPQLQASWADLRDSVVEKVKEDAAPRGKFIDAAHYDDNGTPHCPRCGNISFRARRSGGRWAMGVMTLGVAAPLVSRNVVECTACRTRFGR